MRTVLKVMQSVTVKRTGPNQPKVNSISNKDDVITGNTNDTDASILVIVGDKIYVRRMTGRPLWQIPRFMIRT